MLFLLLLVTPVHAQAQNSNDQLIKLLYQMISMLQSQMAQLTEDNVKLSDKVADSLEKIADNTTPPELRPDPEFKKKPVITMIGPNCEEDIVRFIISGNEFKTGVYDLIENRKIIKTENVKSDGKKYVRYDNLKPDVEYTVRVTVTGAQDSVTNRKPNMIKAFKFVAPDCGKEYIEEESESTPNTRIMPWTVQP